MAWDEELKAFDRDLRARSAAERTRRAYAVDLGQFVEWAGERGPSDIRHRDVRRYAAFLSAEGAAPATVARKLAAIRSLFDFLVRTERASQNPADLVSSPKREEKLPRVLTGEQVRSLLEGIPAHTPLELRDRAMLELAYSCGLRCEEIVNLDLGALDSRNHLDLLAHVLRQNLAHAAAGRRQRHGDGHGAGDDLDVIDEPKLHHRHAELRVENTAQCLDDLLSRRRVRGAGDGGRGSAGRLVGVRGFPDHDERCAAEGSHAARAPAVAAGWRPHRAK